MTWLLRELSGETTLVPCGFCGRTLRAAVAEFCWFCGGPLCGECWDTIGHCGHQAAYEFDRENSQFIRRKRKELGCPD